MMLFLVCLAILVPSARLELNYDYPANSNDDNKTWTELGPLQGQTFLRYPLGDASMEYRHCKKPAKCIQLHSNNTCFGIRLPYKATTLDLIPEDTTQEIVREKLYMLQALKHIPKCWAVVQPFLCSIFMPKCVNNTVDLPSQEICKMVTGACRILLNHTLWPSFIKCHDTKLFSGSCKNDIRTIKYNTTGKCLSPLVPTDNALAIFEGVEGCGMPCNDPLYTQDIHKQNHSYIATATVICCLFNLFNVLTFLIDWRSANKYPALAIFYINCCYMISCFGWLAQFTVGNRDVIVCRKDGTPRMGEPSGENLSCVVVFVLIYYSLIAAMVWFVIFSYTWCMSFSERTLGKIQNRIDKKGAYYHLLAWCLPLVLTVTIMALGEIDGNSVMGICFVGYNNHVVRAWFVIGPMLTALLIGEYFLLRGLISLIRVKINSHEFISERASSKVRENIVRVGLFSAFSAVAVVVTIYCHIYEFEHSSEWKQSFRDYMICTITSQYADVSDCKLNSRPSVAKLQLHLLAYFFAAILMSFWVWTHSTLDTWVRFLKRTCNRETEEPVKLKKHKVIAQAFAKRKMFNNAGRLSISFHNTYEDPVGLNFDFNSVASQDVSSAWAAAVPNFLTRRGALVDESVSSYRRNSTDSQYSFSLRRVSVESRRNSCDSQFALSISEMKAELKTSRVNKNNKRRKKPTERTRKRSESCRRGRRDFEKVRSNKMISNIRRASTTSQESNLHNIQFVAVDAASSIVPLQVPNMGRRAGLDEGALAIKDAERLLPFLFFPRSSDSDENSSSEGKNNEIIVNNGGKVIDLEAENKDSDNEDSQPEEDTKMLESEDVCERSRSKTSNKSSKSFNRNSNRRTSV